MILDNWLAQRAATCPDRTALVADGMRIAYADLESEAAAAARRLAGKGVRPGAAVTLEMPAGAEYVVILHALMKLGAVAVPLNPNLAAREREAQIAAVEPALELTRTGQVTGTEADFPLLGQHDLDSIACRIMTSGTSGAGRSIGLTYGNHLWSAVGSAFRIGVDPTDRWLCCLPLHHVGGLSIALRSVIYGTGAVVHDGFDVEAVARTLDLESVSVMSLVPTQLVRLLDAGVDLSGPRAILVGGGPVPAEMIEDAAGRGASVVPTYGLTEAASQVTTLDPQEVLRRPGSAGRPLLTTHLRIQDGEILVQGPTVAPGCADNEGWLHTGDLGRIDEDGFLYVADRLGDVIVTGGENVVPTEVEEVLMRHPSVAEAAAVGRSDPEWQEAVSAVVVLRDGESTTEDELRDHCAAELASFKVPKRFEFADSLPRTASGKLLRRELR